MLEDSTSYPSIFTWIRVLQKIPFEQGMYDKNVSVLFIEQETDTLKIAFPQYSGVFEKYNSTMQSKLEELQNATYRSSFTDITSSFNWKKMDNTWSQIQDNMFVVTYDKETNEVLQMHQLTNFNANCMAYIYHHLDPKNHSYTKKR